MIRPMNVDTSLERDNGALLSCRSAWCIAKASGSSDTVNVYECRPDGMVAAVERCPIARREASSSEIPPQGLRTGVLW